MRYTTKRKLWGRSQLVVAIRASLSEVAGALKATEAPVPDVASLNKHLEKALAELKAAAAGMDIYGVERKRIQVALQRESKALQTIMAMAKAIPVTQEEKVAARISRAKAR